MFTLVLMMMMMVVVGVKSEAEVEELWTTDGASSVLLDSGLQAKQHHEVRWTHRGLLVRTNHTAECDGGRCQLLSNGSLQLNHITHQHAGNYKLDVYNGSGKLMLRREFWLRVTDYRRSIAGRSAAVSCSLLLLLLLLLCISLFILMRRRRKTREMRPSTPGQTENTYVEMHRTKTNQVQEETDLYVSCNPASPKDTDVYI